ncbi:hypothetical protein BLNAU_1475 [Blattamonas nauphoetae]|uniref:Uncharacterized protein n=1 Tax=Blattamonas nauphoetae TaxID=2049346 RepID=A0ABQ9YI44_9EUKA|nr:hypothetical protein BLNAU_1475 [Blattamonas nauphoetae]
MTTSIRPSSSASLGARRFQRDIEWTNQSTPTPFVVAREIRTINPQRDSYSSISRTLPTRTSTKIHEPVRPQHLSRTRQTRNHLTQYFNIRRNSYLFREPTSLSASLPSLKPDHMTNPEFLTNSKEESDLSSEIPEKNDSLTDTIFDFPRRTSSSLAKRPLPRGPNGSFILANRRLERRREQDSLSVSMIFESENTDSQLSPTHSRPSSSVLLTRSLQKTDSNNPSMSSKRSFASPSSSPNVHRRSNISVRPRSSIELSRLSTDDLLTQSMSPGHRYGINEAPFQKVGLSTIQSRQERESNKDIDRIHDGVLILSSSKKRRRHRPRLSKSAHSPSPVGRIRVKSLSESITTKTKSTTPKTKDQSVLLGTTHSPSLPRRKQGVRHRSLHLTTTPDSSASIRPRNEEADSIIDKTLKDSISQAQTHILERRPSQFIRNPHPYTPPPSSPVSPKHTLSGGDDTDDEEIIEVPHDDPILDIGFSTETITSPTDASLHTQIPTILLPTPPSSPTQTVTPIPTIPQASALLSPHATAPPRPVSVPLPKTDKEPMKFIKKTRAILKSVQDKEDEMWFEKVRQFNKFKRDEEEFARKLKAEEKAKKEEWDFIDRDRPKYKRPTYDHRSHLSTKLEKTGEVFLSRRDLTHIPINIPQDTVVLYLNHNHITEITNINHLYRLKELHISENQISSLGTSLSRFRNLEILSLSDNNLDDLEAVAKSLQPLRNLQRLDLSKNRICDDEAYRHSILSAVPTLTCLDNHLIPDAERERYMTANKRQPKREHVVFGKTLPKTSAALTRTSTKKKATSSQQKKSTAARELAMYVKKMESKEEAQRRRELEEQIEAERELLREKPLPKVLPPPTTPYSPQYLTSQPTSAPDVSRTTQPRTQPKRRQQNYIKVGHFSERVKSETGKVGGVRGHWKAAHNHCDGISYEHLNL